MLDKVRHWHSPRPCRAYQMKQKALYDDPSINIRAKMIRGPRWKYVYRLEGVEELYDLQADPDEIKQPRRGATAYRDSCKSSGNE